jgi:hypothetical protein
LKGDVGMYTASLIRMESMVPSSAFKGSRMVPVPMRGTVFPPIPLTKPSCLENERKSVASLTINRLAPESSTNGKLSVSATKQNGRVEWESEAFALELAVGGQGNNVVVGSDGIDGLANGSVNVLCLASIVQ